MYYVFSEINLVCRRYNFTSDCYIIKAVTNGFEKKLFSTYYYCCVNLIHDYAFLLYPGLKTANNDIPR